MWVGGCETRQEGPGFDGWLDGRHCLTKLQSPRKVSKRCMGGTRSSCRCGMRFTASTSASSKGLASKLPLPPHERSRAVRDVQCLPISLTVAALGRASPYSERRVSLGPIALTHALIAVSGVEPPPKLRLVTTVLLAIRMLAKCEAGQQMDPPSLPPPMAP